MIQISQPAFLGREAEYVAEVIASERLSMGRFVDRFEESLKSYTECAHAVATSSGTAALHLALIAAGLKPGEIVLVPACSYIATANAVKYCGAVPVFVDVDPQTWCFDQERLVNAIKMWKPAGIITVDLYGRRCPLPLDIPEEVWVVEDMCEAHGLPLHARAIAGALSFYGNKIVTCGEGGAVVTRDAGVDARVRLYRGQGQGRTRYVHEVIGYNYRMTEMQAAIGVAQLEKLPKHLALRRLIRSAYDEEFTFRVVGQQHALGVDSDWVCPILVGDPVETAARLYNQGVETRPVFPSLTSQPPYVLDDYRRLLEQCPVAELLGHHGLLLPLHLGVSVDQARQIASMVIEVESEKAA